METVKKDPLSWLEGWGSSKEKIWDSFCQPQNVPHTVIGKTLWITYCRPVSTFLGNPGRRAFSCYQLKPCHWGAGLSVSALNPFPIRNSRNFCLFNGHCISSLLLVGSGPNFLPTSSSSDKHVGVLLWESPVWALLVSHLAPHLSVYFVWSLASLVTHWKLKSCWQDGDCLVPCWHGKGQLQSSRVNKKPPSACRWLVCPWRSHWVYSREECSF